MNRVEGLRLRFLDADKQCWLVRYVMFAVLHCCLQIQALDSVDVIFFKGCPACVWGEANKGSFG